jgi:hypothetical protein
MRQEHTTIARAGTQYRVATAAAYAARHVEALAGLAETEGAIVTPHTEATPQAARINYGRWLTDCPACAAGVSADPAFAEARCFHCGAVIPVTFPAADDVAVIEALLVRRPLTNRHWRPSESPADVARVNRDHGL